ncbi:MAG: hypothetical protein K5764_02715 [Prevotella sp.]|nr:hypothetical protein [Prevotella sp.]
MKKIYKTPMISVTEVHAATMLAASVTVSNTTTTDQQWVKGNNASTPVRSYDVWEDDWSN